MANMNRIANSKVEGANDLIEAIHPINNPTVVYSIIIQIPGAVFFNIKIEDTAGLRTSTEIIIIIVDSVKTQLL